jgi:hypothetical protein
MARPRLIRCELSSGDSSLLRFKKTSNLVLVLSASARQNDRRRQSSFKHLQVVLASDSAGCGTALVSFLFGACPQRVADRFVK